MSTATRYSLRPRYTILATTQNPRLFLVHDRPSAGMNFFRNKLGEACDLLSAEIRSLKHHDTPLTMEQKDKITLSLQALFALHAIVKGLNDDIYRQESSSTETEGF